MTDTLTKEILDAELAYEPETGVFRRLRATNTERIGGIAGNVGANGRRMISVRGVRYMASHLAWLHMTGSLPTGYVKQRNGDYDDCHWDNLFEESPAESARGGRIKSNNTSGFKGVSWDSRRQRWLATIKVGYRLVSLGRFNEKADAISARQRAEQELAATGDVAGVKYEATETAMTARLARVWRKLREATQGNMGWLSFDAFAEDVKAMPKGIHGVEAVDASRPVGTGNWQFVKRFDRRNSDGRAAYDRQRRAESPDLFKAHELKKSFGITLEQFQSMLLAQKGVCEICGEPETMVRRGRVQSLSVDHHHETGAVRDLLCADCNWMVGHSRERPDLLRAAAAYLERHTLAEPDNVVPLPRKERA